MAYGKNKDLTERTESNKVLRDKAFESAINPKYSRYQRGLASMIYKFFEKKSTGSRIKSVWNQQLSNEFDKPITERII